MTMPKALVALAIALCSSPAMAQTPVKIGFVATLSGQQGALGQDMYDGFMLALNLNGSKLGGVPVQVIREDDQGKNEVANQIADKFVERDRVQIVAGINLSNIILTMYRKIVDKEIFFIGTVAGPSQFAGAQCNPFYFQVNGQNDQRAEPVGRYAASKGYKRVIALAPNFQAGKDFLAGFKREYKQPLLDELYTPLTQLDYQGELAQIAAAKPDAVYVFYPGALGIQFVRQWQQAGLSDKIPLLSSSTVDGINLPALKEAALGVISASNWSPDIDNPENRKFVEEFIKRYNRFPSDYAASSYDAANLIGSALAKTGGNVTDKQAFRAAIAQADFKTVRGSLKFNHNQAAIQNLLILEVVKDTQGRYIHKTIDTIANAQDSYHALCMMK